MHGICSLLELRSGTDLQKFWAYVGVVATVLDIADRGCVRLRTSFVALVGTVIGNKNGNTEYEGGVLSIPHPINRWFLDRPVRRMQRLKFFATYFHAVGHENDLLASLKHL